MNLEQLTGQKIFNVNPESFGKVHIDISKRAYDGMYTIWQQMWPFFVDGSWLNIEKEVGGIEYCSISFILQFKYICLEVAVDKK